MNAAESHPPIYVITVDQNGGFRRKNSQTQFDRVGMPFTFIEGITQKHKNSVQIYSRLRNLIWHKRNLSAGEIFVYSSHRKAWQTFLDSDEDVALIAEDDLEITDPEAFKDIMQSAIAPDKWDILKLFDYRPKKAVNSEDWRGKTLVDYKYPASGCVAYLITRSAARKLLSRSKIYRPVDEDFSFCWEFGLCVRSVSPNIVDEISENLGGSTLEIDRRRVRKQKNLLRSLWGIGLQVGKQLRARRYSRGLMKPRQ